MAITVDTRILIKTGWALNTLIGASQVDVIKIGDNGGAAEVDVAGKLVTTTLQMTTGAGAGKILQSDASGNASWVVASGTGTVTTVSVVSANGLAGTVANASTTPAITLSTSVTGLLKGNGTAISAASDGTDYLSPTTGVTLSQATPQTIGTTTNRVVKLWATDITVTNAIAGSVTGNAGTVTNATLTTALTVNTGAVTLTGNVAGSTLTLGAGANSFSGTSSGTNTGDQTTVSGNAGSASTIAIVDDTTTNATMYPLWVTANTGNLAAKVTSTKMSYNPSTGLLSNTRLAITGTAGAGYITLVAQASNPTSPAAGTLLLHSSTTGGFTRLEQDNEGTTNLVIGRDTVFVARNTTGSTITKGSAVYISGATGTIPNITKARANASTTLPCVGIVLDDITNNNNGQVMVIGIISSIDTSAFSVGDQLWVSTATAGVLQNTRPSGTSAALVQRIGSVLVSGVGNGAILVDIAPFIGNLETGTTAATFAANAVTASSYNGLTLTTTTGTFTLTNAKTLAVTNSLTLSGTDGTTMTFPSTSSTVMTLASTDTITGAKSFNSGNLKLNGATSGTIILNATAVAGTNTLTLPAATDTLVGKATTDTLTNKRITMRVTTETSSATPTINTDNADVHEITALAVAITSMTTNLSGTPTNDQMLLVRILGTAARAITWGASFEDWTVALPTTTVTTKWLEVLLQYHTSSSKWGCVYTASQL